jgi:sugar lactone lactonase YvrE
MRTLMSGLRIGESPRWHDRRLWFANWGAAEVLAVDLQGKSEVMARVPTHIPFSIDWLADGTLLIVAGREGLLLRQEQDGSLVTHADLSTLSSHPWNEIVVDGRGNTYLDNIGFDLMAGADPAAGIVALVAPDGSARQVADGVEFPNGMVVTPDNSTLIVAESYASRLTAFDIEPDGGLSNRRVWADLDGGAPDGICIDADGAIWYADVPNRRCVRVREGGEVLEAVALDRGCFACMLGGEDGCTLFMMAASWGGPDAMAGGARTGQVLTVRAPSPGVGWPGPGAPDALTRQNR